jgi:pimeloyl-ACP methyl ester carboxylesterase
MSRLSTFHHDGLDFDVLEGGPVDGEPVVLLHGFPERATAWDGVTELLQAQGLHTLAPDQRGYSPGARPRGRWSYRLSRLVGDVVALAERTGGPVHVVGHDWGAIVGWALAAQRPDLVRSLTAVSVPHPGAFLGAALHGDQLAKSWYFALFATPLLVETMLAAKPDAFDVPLRKGGMTREDVARFHTDIVESGALPGALGWYRALPFVPPSLARAQIIVPTTYVWSDRDVALTRDAAERCAAHVSADYELVVLAGVSHWVPRQAPEQLADAILARVRSTR